MSLRRNRLAVRRLLQALLETQRRHLLLGLLLACTTTLAGVLLLGGAVPYVIDAWNRLAEWFQLATVSPIPPGITAGLVVLGVGIVLMLASRLIPFRPRKKLPPKSKTPPKSTATRGRPIYDSTSQSTPSDTTTTP